jgi:hypothetical protein
MPVAPGPRKISAVKELNSPEHKALQAKMVELEAQYPTRFELENACREHKITYSSGCKRAHAIRLLAQEILRKEALYAVV